MNENNSAQGNEKQQPENPARENGKDSTQENAYYSDHTQDSADESVDEVERVIRGIMREWSKLDFFKRFELAISVIGIVVLIVYTIFTGFMYAANQKSADAAKSAADTASDALVISERAYLSFGSADFDTAKKSIKIPIVNTGHIPSGEITITGYNLVLSTEEQAGGLILECDYGAYPMPSVAPGIGPNYEIVLRQLSRDTFLAGHQKVIVIGDLSYNDGFPYTQIRHSRVCAESIYHTDLKQSVLLPCAADFYLPTLEKEPACHQAKK